MGYKAKNRPWPTWALSFRSCLAGLVQAIEVHTGFQASAIRGAPNAPRAIYTIPFASGTLQCLGRKLWCSGTRRQNQWCERKDEKSPHVDPPGWKPLVLRTAITPASLAGGIPRILRVLRYRLYPHLSRVIIPLRDGFGYNNGQETHTLCM